MSVDVVLVNLTRFGDLLQSQTVIDDLHAAGYKVGLVCLENFAAALPLLRNVEKAWPLKGSRLLADLDSDWHRALADLADFAATVREEGGARFALNLTPSLPARLLARLLMPDGAQNYGFCIDEFGYSLNKGAWATFFLAAARKRANSPFNLSDLLRQMAAPLANGRKGSFKLARPGLEDWAKAYLAKKAGSFPAKGYVAFQLGASQDNRRWPARYFRELGKIIQEQTGLAPVLVGSPSERGLGDEYAKGADHFFINAIGETDIPQLAAILAQCGLLVTNDTGTMHLAAGLETPILAFFLATAQPWDTGPLLPGSISLEPALDCHPCAFGADCPRDCACASRISPQDAAYYAFAQLGLPVAANPPLTARAWRTALDEDNFLALSPMQGAPLSPHSLLILWLRAFWLGLLARMESQSGDDSALLSAYSGLPRIPDAERLASALKHAADLLSGIAEAAPLAAIRPQMGKIVLRNAERLQAELDNCGQLASLASFWREFRHNLTGEIGVFGERAKIMSAHLLAFAAALESA